MVDTVKSVHPDNTKSRKENVKLGQSTYTVKYLTLGTLSISKVQCNGLSKKI